MTKLHSEILTDSFTVAKLHSEILTDSFTVTKLRSEISDRDRSAMIETASH